MSFSEQFAANLCCLRERAGITQEELSFRAGLHRTEIGLLERGGRIPRIDTVAKLAGGLEVKPGELFEGIMWEPGAMHRGHFAETSKDASCPPCTQNARPNRGS